MGILINKFGVWLLLAMALAIVPFLVAGQTFILTIFSLVLVNTIAALGLNIVIGYAGQISIGHAAFMAIGAYFSVIMSMNFNVPFILSLMGAGAVSGFFGLLLGIPSLRLKGFYLAIATMAFGVVVEQTLQSWTYVGGTIGVRNVPPPEIFGLFLKSDLSKYYLIALVSFIIFIFTSNIMKSRTGRAFKAIRESQFAAQSMGINISKYKLIAFVISAVYAGVAGSLYAHTIGYISPLDFNLGVSINLLAMIVIGGLGSISGAFIGSVIIIAMPFFFSRTSLPMSIIIGVMLVIVVLFFPRGIAYGLRVFELKYLWKPYTALRRLLTTKRREKGNYVEVEGKKIFYIESGDPVGQPVIYIHGNFGSWRWFKPVMDLMPVKYRSIALDMPNFGRSERIDEVTIDNYSDYVYGFMQALKLERVFVVAHSLGGAVAQKLLIDHPDRVIRTVLVDPAPPSGLTTAPELYALLDMYRNNAPLLRKALINVMPTRKVDNFTERIVDDALLMDPRCFVLNARALEEYDYTEEIRKTDIPLLVLVGKKDLIVSRKMAEEFLELNPGAEVEVVEACGHSVNVEKPDFFTDRLIEFFETT